MGKETAYEQELLEQKQSEREASLGALSDYWKEDILEVPQEEKNTTSPNAIAHSGQTYRDIHHTLGNFYQDNSAYEEQQKLQEEIQRLKSQLSEKENQDPLDTQMALMEKSYQMAAKYMPQIDNTGMKNIPKEINEDTTTNEATSNRNEQEHSFSVYNTEKVVVSRLQRNLFNNIAEQRQFINVNQVVPPFSVISKNSIKACVHTLQNIEENSRVRLRLLEPIRVAQIIIPKGELLTATAKVNGDRLLLEINSIEYKGNIIPVSLTAYDLDGQQGLYLPYNPDANAFREIASSMSSNSGTNFTFNSSAKDQVVSDLSKGVIQGTSAYLSKKIARPAIKVKAGHQVLLVAKK